MQRLRFEHPEVRCVVLRSGKSGIFCAGEMLDWEAPTGGYLLQASMASGRVAGQGAAAYFSCSRDR